MSSTLNKVGKDLVLDLLNKDNQATLSSALTFQQVNFSLPQAIANPTSPLQKRGPSGEILYRNTRVLVTARPGAPFIGSKTVDYHRIDVDVLFRAPYRSLMGNGITSSLDLVQMLNNRFGLQLEAGDIVIEPIDTTTLPTTYVMKMTPECYSFRGQVEFELIADLPDLEELILVNLLEGFHYAPAQEDDVGNPHHVTGSGQLMAMFGQHSVPGASMLKSDNEELEVFAAIFDADLANVTPVLPVGGTFSLDITGNRRLAMAFGAGLLSELRGSDLVNMYDIQLEVRKDNGEDGVETLLITLKNDSNNQLVWDVNGGLSDITNSAVLGKYMIQTVIDLTTVASLFPSAYLNGVGQFSGQYELVFRAVAKRAIYVNDIYRPFSLVINDDDINTTPNPFSLEVDVDSDSAILLRVLKNNQPINRNVEGITGKFEFVLERFDSETQEYMQISAINTDYSEFVLSAFDANYSSETDEEVLYRGKVRFTNANGMNNLTTDYSLTSDLSIDYDMGYSDSQMSGPGEGEITVTIQTRYGPGGNLQYVSDASLITMKLYTPDGDIIDTVNPDNASIEYVYSVLDRQGVLRWTHNDNGTIHSRATNIFFGGLA